MHEVSLWTEVAWFPLPQQVTSLRCSNCRWVQLQVIVQSVPNQLLQHGSYSQTSLLLSMPYTGYHDQLVLGPSFKALDQGLGLAGRDPRLALLPRRPIHALCVGWRSFLIVHALDINGRIKIGHVLGMHAHTVPRSSTAKTTSQSMSEQSTAPQRSTLPDVGE